MELIFKIKRFNPEKDKKPYFQTYTVKAEKSDRILDCMNKIKWEQDGTLTYRQSCAHGICGSDAMKINGINQLACQTLVKDINNGEIVIEPLPAMAVIKDLVVDLDGFFDKYEVVKPFLISKTPPPYKERLQSKKQRKLLDGSYECILCGACTSACPSYWTDKKYLVPAALLKAYRFVFDSRDEATAERLRILDGEHEIWKCHTIFNCAEVCPKELNPGWAISELKKLLIKRKF